MKIFIGIDKYNELVYLQWDKAENQQRNMFSLSGGTYRDPITEGKGEENARKYLEDGELWQMADQSGNTTSGLSDWVEEVLSIDGWMHTLGDVEDFGEYENETMYMQLSSCGQHRLKDEEYKVLFIDSEDLDIISELWDEKHLKPLTEDSLKIMDAFFDKYKKLCSQQEALNLFMHNQ